MCLELMRKDLSVLELKIYIYIYQMEAEILGDQRLAERERDL